MNHYLKFTLFVFFIITFFNECPQEDENSDIPVCIENIITTILNEEVSNPPTQIWKWEVYNDAYYYITSNCCDQYNYLYNLNCEVICAPDGGLIGNRDGNVPLLIVKLPNQSFVKIHVNKNYFTVSITL